MTSQKLINFVEDNKRKLRTVSIFEKLAKKKGFSKSETDTYISDWEFIYNFGSPKDVPIPIRNWFRRKRK